jgi:hypothetical protein
MTVRCRAWGLVFASVVVGCGSDGGGPAGVGDSGVPLDVGLGLDAASGGGDAGTTAARDAGLPVDAGLPRIVPGGDVSGDWCGAISVEGAVTVPAGQTLTLCEGVTVAFGAGVGITVVGALRANGSAAARVRLSSSPGSRWSGISVRGTLDAHFTDVSDAALAIEGRAGSSITFNDGSIASSQFTLRLLAGGTFDRTRITGGGTLALEGGVWRMTDSVIDLGHPVVSPDCTSVTAGGLTFDHVRVTGCHCPIHISRATDAVTITNSVLDQSTNAIMIANARAEIHGNNLLGVGTRVLDIGGGIAADVAGNYWGGDRADVGTGSPSQFTGTAMIERAPIPGAGPRP